MRLCILRLSLVLMADDTAACTDMLDDRHVAIVSENSSNDSNRDFILIDPRYSDVGWEAPFRKDNRMDVMRVYPALLLQSCRSLSRST